MLRERHDPDPVRRERARAGLLPSCTSELVGGRAAHARLGRQAALCVGAGSRPLAARSERARPPIRARTCERDHLARCPKVARNGDRPWLNGTRRAPPGEVSSEWASVQECRLMRERLAILSVSRRSSSIRPTRPRTGHAAKVRDRLNTYTAYSIGCAVAWAVLLAAVATGATRATLHVILLVFAGWVIGWISATIARFVYPPPKSRRPWSRKPEI